MTDRSALRYWMGECCTTRTPQSRTLTLWLHTRVDIDIEADTTQYFDSMVKAINGAALKRRDLKHYYLSGAPQCPNPPDEHMQEYVGSVDIACIS